MTNERLVGELRLRGDRMSHRAADAIEAGAARIKELEAALDWAPDRGGSSDVLRAQLSTWLTQALDIGFEVTETDLLALREWIDAGCPGECPDPKGRQNGENDD